MIGINAMAMASGSALADIGDECIKIGCSLLEKGCDACKNMLTLLKSWDVMDILGADTTFSAAASAIAMLLLTIELCSQAMGFHFDDINEGFRFVFKIVVYKIIIENSSNIVRIVYGLFFKAEAWDKLASNFSTIGSNFSKIPGEINATMSGMDEGVLGVAKLFAGIAIGAVSIFAFIILVKIVISLAGIIFEIGIDIVVAPVPIATLVSHETRSIGINFLKGFAANCMTVSMYGVCFTVYNGISSHITTSFAKDALGIADGVLSGVGFVIPHLISLLLLSVATKNASNMMSKILG